MNPANFDQFSSRQLRASCERHGFTSTFLLLHKKSILSPRKSLQMDIKSPSGSISDLGDDERVNSSTPIRDLNCNISDENIRDRGENVLESSLETQQNTISSANTTDQSYQDVPESWRDSGAFFENVPSGDQSISSQDTNSQEESRDSSCRFSKIRELNEGFSRKRTEKKSRVNCCRFCNWYNTSNNTSRCINHAKNCKGFDPDVRERLVSSYNLETNLDYSSRNSKLNLMWAKVIAANNFSFRSLESQSFKDFLKFIQIGWKVDDRHLYSSKHVSKLGYLVDKQFINRLKTMPRYSLSAEFDHWLDSTKRSLFGLIVTFVNGDRHIVNLEDVSCDGKSAEVIVEGINRSLKAMPSVSLNSIMSDSDSACKKAREMIVETKEYQHIIQHRCIAHLLNRMGDCFTTKAVIRETMGWAESVSAFSSNDPKIRAKVKETGAKKVVKGCQTRWYANADMLDSLVSNQTVIVEEVTRNITASESDRRINLVRKVEHWDKIKLASKLMRPMADCIATAERKSGSLGEAVKSMLELGRGFFTSDWNNSLNIAAIESYLTYFSTKKLDSEEFGLCIAAYILDRRHNLDYITEDGIDLALGSVTLVAMKSDVSSETIEKSLVPEFNNYCLWKGKYGRPAKISETALDWWSSLRDRGSFEEVAIRIARLRSSSANIERTFSILKLVQGYSRTNFNIETLLNLAKVRVSEDECLHDFLELSIRDEIDEEVASQDISSQSSTRSESSVALQSLSIENNANNATTAHLRALTSRNTRVLYRSFSKLVNFKIV